MITRHCTLVVAAVTGLGLLISGSACRNQQRGARDARAAAAGERRVVLDGRFEDWPQGVAVQADGEFLYFRVSVEGGQAPLQAAPETLALWIDVDGRAQTGMRFPAPAEASGLGVDAVVEFSPRGQDGRMRPGVVVYSVDSSGVRAPLSAGMVGLSSAPTYAAPGYEIRLSRHPDAEVAPVLRELLQGRGRGAAMFVLSDSGGQMVGWSDPETFALPAARERSLADVTVPEKTAESVRVMSYNVKRSELMRNPSSFARLIQVVDPDILLLQEWDTDAATARAWFAATVTGEREWHAVTGARDVVIVSKHPLQPLGPEAVMTEEEGEAEPRPVRVVGALVQTRAGPVAAASLHLKCCGTAGSSEDRRRMAEARGINSALSSAIQQSGARMAVIGGDYNLVGTRTPLDLLRMRMDMDGSEMEVAEPMMLGDGVMYTWRDDQEPFPPGRLDYVIYSGATAEVVNAFLVDTGRLSERALARMGLDRTDSGGSDHLPVVVDLRGR